MVAKAPTRDIWLYGPARDLLLGCGVLYALLFAVFAVSGEAIRAAQPAVLLPLLILLTSTPHYGATLVRVYEHRRDRRAYAYFTVWITLALLLLFVIAVYDDLVASLMLTVYLTWSPWHYTGQNYGVGMMLVRRAGVEIEPVTRRLIYASFILSYALTFLALHDSSGRVTDSVVGYSGQGVRFLSLGLPTQVVSAAIVLLLLACLGSAAVAAVRLLRVAPARNLLPLGAIWITQALWFSLPLSVRGLGLTTPVEPLSTDLRAHYFLWIAVGHAVQYLWVTSYYARSSAGWHGMPAWYVKVLLAGNAAWVLPVMLFTPDGIGRLSYDAGLALTVASVVNLHHFVLDGAIWKLRSTRIADVLIRSARDGTDDLAPGAAGVRGRLGRRLLWGATALVLVASGWENWERLVHRPGAATRGEFQEVRASLDRTAWIGRDSAVLRVKLGNAFARGGDHDAAAVEYLRSLELRPNSQALDGIGLLLLHEQRPKEALAYFEAALAESPDSPGIMQHAARALRELGDASGASEMNARARALGLSDDASARAGSPAPAGWADSPSTE